jgi:hypothetical protein
VKNMTKSEAITTLAACAPLAQLAQRLAAQGVNIELTEQDRAALGRFRVIWWDDWDFLEDPNVPLEAGLTPVLLNLLNAKANLEMERMRW